MKWSGSYGRTEHKPYRWVWRRRTPSGLIGERYPWRLILGDAWPIMTLMGVVIALLIAAVALAVRVWYTWVTILGG
jgi:hypothetical protein